MWLGLAAYSQPHYTVVHYDEEDGLPHGHVTQLLQDELGFLWFATWNGLCRYDGYEFRSFKPAMGDGCHIATDRFRDIALLPGGRMICRVDEDYYWFNTHTCQFSNMTDEEATRAVDQIKQYRQSFSVKNIPDSLAGHFAQQPFSGGSFALTDRQGILWVLSGNGIYKIGKNEQRVEPLEIVPKAQVKCLFTDRRQRYWIATKEDGAVRVFDGSNDKLLGYLGVDGRLHQQYTRFGAAVYCMYQSADGTMWLGTKPDGLFRLREKADETFEIDHFTDIPSGSVYHIATDGYGRLWLATLGGGLCYSDQPSSAIPRFLVPSGFPKDVAQRVRYLNFSQDGGVLMAATTDGLLVAKVERDVEKMRFHRHFRESDRAASLSSSATMDITTVGGHYYVSTESGGVNRLDCGASDQQQALLANQLAFTHYQETNHRLPSDVVLSTSPMDSVQLMVVSGHLIALLDSTGRYRQLDARFFNADYRFSDAHPQPLRDGRWLFGLTDGAFITSVRQMYRQAYKPSVVLTGISIQGVGDNWAIAHADTIVLLPHERSFTIHFAALDLHAPERICYAFRLLPQERWLTTAHPDHSSENYVGHDRSATLLNLSPGTYLLEVRSTDAEGQWLDNVRTLTIIVRPTFWEAWYGQLLLVLLGAGLLAAILYTYIYIRRIKRQHKETLEAYLTLLNKPEGDTQGDGTVERVVPLVKTEDDVLLKRIMSFLEENLSDDSIGVGDMAAAAAISRSGLQRKLKQTMGITPQELLHEARIKRACQLLHSTDKSIAEVAYCCGFTDPKYFSRCFRQSIGQSPSEYKVSS